LSTFPNAQLVVIGPICDGYGHYAAQTLQAIADKPENEGRLHVFFEFKALSDEIKFAADFCLMPSRDEPFGYVDVEFAWRGALVVGARAGGLGKVPGFYYVAQNRENIVRLRRELKTAIRSAMQTPDAQLEQMSERAMNCSFPLEEWQAKLMKLYGEILPQGGLADISLSADSVPRVVNNVVSSFGPPRTRAQSSYVSFSSPISVFDITMEAETRGGGLSWEPRSHAFVEEAAEQEVPIQCLRQEPSEEELSDRVKDKLTMHPSLGMQDVLEDIGSDLNIEAERYKMPKLLATPVMGTPLIHILVSVGYVASPVGPLLTAVVGTEWGLRGSENLPRWLSEANWFQRLFGGPSLDPSILAMIFFLANSIATCIFAPIWATLAKRHQPRHLLAASFLLNLPIVLTLVPTEPNVLFALLLVFLQGAASSGLFLFVCFNFMLSVKPDMTESALRMGMLEAMRAFVNWILFAYVLLASPSSVAGTKENPLPIELSWRLLPLAVLVLIFSIAPGLLCLWAPGPYRDDRAPTEGVGRVWSRRSVVLLAASEFVGGLLGFPNTRYMAWWMENGWPIDRLGSICIFMALGLSLVLLAWTKFLRSSAVHGYYLLIGTALLLAPASLLQCVVYEEVSTYTFQGVSLSAFALSFVSVILDLVRTSSIWALKIQILNSRWRLLTYCSAVLALTGCANAISPGVCEVIARFSAATYITSNQKEMADAMRATVLPLGTAQYILQLLAMFFVRRDLRVAQSWRTSRCRALLPTIAVLGGLGLTIAVCLSSTGTKDNPPRVRRCKGPVQPACKVLYEGTNDAPARFGYRSFGRNQYGMTTTGRYNCLQQMHYYEGDTFLFWESGRCEVQQCQDAASVKVNSSEMIPLEFEAWSVYCSMSGQQLTAVQLLEWRWQDVGEECERQLGPAGINVVQISPPSEHTVGETWAVRYQPVSYKLESRAGTEEEFVTMVAKCEAAGVSVMADLVLNHMASPYVLSPTSELGKVCGSNESTEKTSTLPCEGWAGTRYGNRDFSYGQPGLDRYSPHNFHHYKLNLLSNCAFPPFANNRHICDLHALPDLDTESIKVQEMLQAYIGHLFEIGVRMFRIDAAAHIYPDSIDRILSPFPVEYITLEIYGQFATGDPARDQLLNIGAFTNFDYGQYVSERFFDTRKVKKWDANLEAFNRLLDLRPHAPSRDACNRLPCDNPFDRYFGSMSLVFLDNQDVQRQKWSGDAQAEIPIEDVLCDWSGVGVGTCRLSYKMGLAYHQAMLFMLAWPFGDAVRIMSSFSFQRFGQGPPGVGNNSRHDKTDIVKCRGMPSTAPISEEYESDEDNRWICEHRWQGISPLIRFRNLVKGRTSVSTPGIVDHSEPGRISFSLTPKKGDRRYCEGLVALQKGYNYISKVGYQTDWELNREETCLPPGKYCNLAVQKAPWPKPNSWGGTCDGEWFQLARNKTEKLTYFNGGIVSPHGLIALHVAYSTLRQDLFANKKSKMRAGRHDDGNNNDDDNDNDEEEEDDGKPWDWDWDAMDETNYVAEDDGVDIVGEGFSLDDSSTANEEEEEDNSGRIVV